MPYTAPPSFQPASALLVSHPVDVPVPAQQLPEGIAGEDYCPEHLCGAKYGVASKDGPNKGRPFRVCMVDGCKTMRFSWTDGKGHIAAAPQALPYGSRAPGGPVPGAVDAALQTMQSAIERLEQRLNDYITYANAQEIEQAQRAEEVTQMAFDTRAAVKEMLDRAKERRAARSRSPLSRHSERPGKAAREAPKGTPPRSRYSGDEE